LKDRRKIKRREGELEASQKERRVAGEGEPSIPGIPDQVQGEKRGELWEKGSELQGGKERNECGKRALAKEQNLSW